MSLGLELAGFEPILAAELNPSARLTYQANRTYLAADRVRGDVRELARMSSKRLRALLELDQGDHPTILTGGPPCQGFSGIGHRRTHSDVEKEEIVSNHLYEDMVDIIAKIEPEVFVFENVRGLLSARWHRERPERVWDSVRHRFLSRLGSRYAIAFQLVHGYDYGVPQNRPRVLMVGLRAARWDRLQTGISIETLNDAFSAGEPLGVRAGLLPAPRRRKGFPPDIVDLLGDLSDPDWDRRTDDRGHRRCDFYPRAARGDWQLAMRAKFCDDDGHIGAGADLAEQEYSKHSSHVVHRFEAIRNSESGQAPLELRTRKFAQRLLPARWVGLPNITVASLPDDYVHFQHNRSFTVREWARLQGFPDWYRFCGPRTTGGHRRAGDVRSGDSVREAPKYTQIGNAVPVALAASIGWHVRHMLGISPSKFAGRLGRTRIAHLLREHFE